MRRLTIALGLIIACVGILVCWPLARMWFSHEQGKINILAIFTAPSTNNQVELHVVWEVEVTPGNWVINDAQASRFFRPIPLPIMSPARAQEIALRLQTPDGLSPPIRAFWHMNDPAETAFILDVTATHPWRRYIAGLAACIAGIITMRLAWTYGRWNPR